MLGPDDTGQPDISIWSLVQFACLGCHLSERATGGGVAILRPIFRTFAALGRVFQIFCPLKVPFLSFHPFFHKFSFVYSRAIKMRYLVRSRIPKLRFCVRSISTDVPL